MYWVFLQAPDVVSIKRIWTEISSYYAEEGGRLSRHKARVGISAGHCHSWKLCYVLRFLTPPRHFGLKPEGTEEHSEYQPNPWLQCFVYSIRNLIKECESNNLITFKRNTQVPYHRPEVKWYSYPLVKCFPPHTKRCLLKCCCCKNALGIKATGIIVSVHVVDKILLLLSTLAHCNSFWWGKADR